MRNVRLITLFAVYVFVIAVAVGKATAATSSGITRHDRQVIRFFHNHPRLAATPEGGKVLARILPRVMRSLQAAEKPAWPSHHALWGCISRYESGGNPGAINSNGHYGLLQMHAGWGYGTSYHASDDSQFVQEQAAENAYAASGHSTSFLYGQWFNYDNAAGECLRYA